MGKYCFYLSFNLIVFIKWGYIDSVNVFFLIIILWGRVGWCYYFYVVGGERFREVKGFVYVVYLINDFVVMWIFIFFEFKF